MPRAAQLFPAYFTVSHGNRALHLQRSNGDVFLNDTVFFDDMRDAAEKYFTDLNSDPALQTIMLARLNNIDKGGAIYIPE